MSFQERVISEKEALEVKLNDLSKFLTDLEQGAIDIAISQEHVALLNTQLLHMTGYLTVLIKRIALFSVASSTEVIGVATDNTSEIIGYVEPIAEIS